MYTASPARPPTSRGNWALMAICILRNFVEHAVGAGLQPAHNARHDGCRSIDSNYTPDLCLPNPWWSTCHEVNGVDLRCMTYAAASVIAHFTNLLGSLEAAYRVLLFL